MAITKAIENAKAQKAAQEAGNQATPAPTPASSSAPAPKAKAGAQNTAKQQKTEAFRKEGESIRAGLTEDQKALEGTKRDTVEFLAALGNPAVSQSIRSGQTYNPGFRVVGYKVRLKEEAEVPYAPLKEDPKSELDVMPVTMRKQPAGAVLNLNIVETAMFISKLEYAGKFTGGAIGVYISPVASDNSADVRPALKKLGGGSIKENMELIADMVGGDGKTKSGGATPVLKDEYKETFANLYTMQKMRKGSAAAKEKDDTQADYAAAFRKFYGI